MTLKTKLLLGAGAATLAMVAITGAVASGRASDCGVTCPKADCDKACPKGGPCPPCPPCPGC